MKSVVRKNTAAAILLAAILLAGIEAIAQQNVKGNENVTEVEYQVDNFSAIEVGSAFKVFLESAGSPLVKIETDDNLHEQISLRVAEGKLMIGSKGITNPTKLNVYVYYTSLVAADISGAATLNTNNQLKTREFVLNLSGASKAALDLDVDQLISELSGASNATLEGKAGLHITEVSGAAKLNASGLLTQNTKAKVSGVGKATVTASDKIDSDVSGAGKLEYFDGKSMVQIGKEGQFSIHIDEDISIDSLGYIDIQSNDNNDSVRIRLGNLEIEVSDGERTRVKVGPGQLEVDESGKVKLTKEKKKPKFNGHWAGFYMGINGYLTADNSIDLPQEYSFLDLRYEKSINVHLNIFEQNFPLISNKFGLVTGLGIEWNNYRFDSDVKLDGSQDEITTTNIPEGVRSTKSKLNVRYLNVPLILEYQTNSKNNTNSFHIGAGVVGGLRIGSHIKNIYEGGGKRKDKVRDDFHLSPLKADAILKLGWGKLNLYGTYSLTSLFRENRGPELYPFSVGITLLSF